MLLRFSYFFIVLILLSSCGNLTQRSTDSPTSGVENPNTKDPSSENPKNANCKPADADRFEMKVFKQLAAEGDFIEKLYFYWKDDSENGMVDFYFRSSLQVDPIIFSGVSLPFVYENNDQFSKVYFSARKSNDGSPPSLSEYVEIDLKTDIHPIQFNYWISPNGPISLLQILDDFDGDGVVEEVDAYYQLGGTFNTVSLDSIGLGDIVAQGRFQVSGLSADLNQDGKSDLLSIAYGNYLNNINLAQLYFNLGDGTFQKDSGFAQLMAKGYGETPIVADFDNDNDLDLFLPYYSHQYPQEHSFMLINDGAGHFTDISEQAGVSLRNISPAFRVEGAQVLDINNDGWLDFYVASHLFINNKNLTFTNVRESLGLPLLFDEGINFLDWNNDGLFDLVLFRPVSGPVLYQNTGSGFIYMDVIPPFTYGDFSMNAYDLNNDGLVDIIPSGQFSEDRPVLLNTGCEYILSNTTSLNTTSAPSSPSFADFNQDGKIDLVNRGFIKDVQLDTVMYFENISEIEDNVYFVVSVLGPNGERNQYGRTVQLNPLSRPDFVISRLVDSGSGYRNKNQYELLIGSPFSEKHHAKVYYQNKIVEFDIEPFQKVNVFPEGIEFE